ncbi:MAG: antiterminator LoaP [Erysipelotrichaceae bacterium]|nr:antiterminator LoaP [Erysipelotrichaceae bacterium]
MNWYAVQVRSGCEQKIAKKCRNTIDAELLYDCIVPQYVYAKKYEGLWHEEKGILFPGYIFMLSDKVELLNVEVRSLPDFVRILGKKQLEFYPLEADEVCFLQHFGADSNVVAMSKGFIEGDRIFISEGPLQGREGLIVKIDRHKRMAYLRLSMFQKELTAKVGLEIISKCQ